MTTVKPKAAAKQKATASLGSEERTQKIAELAYFMAEKRGFSPGDPVQDWLAAEKEIDALFRKGSVASRSKISLSTAKKEFQKTLEAQLHEWDIKLTELKSKAETVSADIRDDYEKQLEILVEKRGLVEQRVLELRSLTEDVWGDLKVGTEKAWDEIHKALEKIAAKLK